MLIFCPKARNGRGEFAYSDTREANRRMRNLYEAGHKGVYLEECDGHYHVKLGKVAPPPVCACGKPLQRSHKIMCVSCDKPTCRKCKKANTLGFCATCIVAYREQYERDRKRALRRARERHPTSRPHSRRDTGQGVVWTPPRGSSGNGGFYCEKCGFSSKSRQVSHACHA